MSRIGENHLETDTYVIPATGATAVTKGDAVKLIAGGPNYASLSTAATDAVQGVALHDADAGETFTVVRRGQTLLNIAENTVVAIGDKLAPSTGGKWVVVSATSSPYWAIARSTTLGTGFEECLADLLYLAPALTPAA